MAERELFVITKAKDLGNYIYTITDKSPKKFRFTLVSKLQNLSIDVIENLYRANSVYVRGSNDTVRIEKRKGYQKEAYISGRTHAVSGRDDGAFVKYEDIHFSGNVRSIIILCSF